VSGADAAGDPGPQTSRELAGRLDQVEELLRTLAVEVRRDVKDLKRGQARVEQPPRAPSAPEPEPGQLTRDTQQRGPAPSAGEPGAEPEPKGWADRATGKDWKQLAGWVDWLVTSYDLLLSRSVLPCWPTHRGVVEELAALRTSWRAATKADQAKDPSDALAQWHEGLLHPCLLRLRQTYQQKQCEDRHRPPQPGHTTDPDRLAPLLDDAGQQEATRAPDRQ